ncbi:MAG: tRNA (adenosine(37)-N6)-threonylcarbamoyltransferase complex ATPase subunit type 1 TsaE [Pseudomonadota bacterium]
MTFSRTWKKVLKADLAYIANELREAVKKPAVIILSGPLGAGKTTFTQAFVGGGQLVSSPIYSVINENAEVAHADFFRLKEARELDHLEIPLYLEEKEFFLVEWGLPFLTELQKIVGDEFYFYELEIIVNEKQSSEEIPSRNLVLKELD